MFKGDIGHVVTGLSSRDKDSPFELEIDEGASKNLEKE